MTNLIDKISLRAEYKILNKKIEKLMGETNTLAKYGIIGTVSAWVWFSENSDTYSNHPYLLWLPTVFTLILGCRSLVLTKELLDLGKFIAPIENAMNIPEKLGWEQHLQIKRKGRKGEFDTTNLIGYLSGGYLIAIVYWVVLLLLTIFIPIVIP